MAQRVRVVMPAYNAASTIASTIDGLPQELKPGVLVCDDASTDTTLAVCQELGLDVISHSVNRGYGGNQKSLYDRALAEGTEFVIMLHPDNQYDADSLPAMIDALASGKADVVLGTRMKNARANGMPLWRFISNRGLSCLQRQVYRRNHSEFHTGLRGYSAKILKVMPYQVFSDKFVFDSELLAWSIAQGYSIAEVDTNCYYAKHVSSIRFWPSVRYGLETLAVLWRYKRGAYTRLGERD